MNVLIYGGIAAAVLVIGLLRTFRKGSPLRERLGYWLWNRDPIMRTPVDIYRDGTEKLYSVRQPSGCHRIVVVFALSSSCLCCYLAAFQGLWEMPLVIARGDLAQAKAPTATPKPAPATWTPQPTYTPLPTYTPIPPTATQTHTPEPTPLHTWTPFPTYTALPTYTPQGNPTETPSRTPALLISPKTPSSVPKLVLKPLTDSVSAVSMSLNVITVTATVTPTAVPTWLAWHVTQMDVRTVDGDGSTEIRNVLIDARGVATHSLDIKCRMSNAENDYRVNESDSQKTLHHNGVPAYTFYSGQQTTWDIQFYKYVSEHQAVDISELLKLPVGQNQIIEIYWEFGECPMVQHAQVQPGAGLDNGRSAPVQQPSAPEPVVVQTVIVVTATPQPVPTNTPWIIYVPYQPSATATRFTYPTWTPQATYTAFPTETPRPPASSATPSPYPPPLLTPLSPSGSARGMMHMSVYLPLIVKL